MRSASIAVLGCLLTAGVLPGCVGDPDRGQLPPFTACDPGAGDDPYPQDTVFARRHVNLTDEGLRMAGCVVNGQDSEETIATCGRSQPVNVTVEQGADAEVVFARPSLDVEHTASCREWSIPANAEWEEARFDILWSLEKDVCRDDEECADPGEGEPVPGGRYTVTIDGLAARPQTWNVTLP